MEHDRDTASSHLRVSALLSRLKVGYLKRKHRRHVLAAFTSDNHKGEIETVIEHFSMLLIPLTLVACTEAISRPKVVSVVVGIEDISSASVSDTSFEESDDSFILPMSSGGYGYIAGFGAQDTCNEMTVDGVYGYYVTADYRYLVGCYRGAPDESFHEAREERQMRNHSAVGSTPHGENSQDF